MGTTEPEPVLENLTSNSREACAYLTVKYGLHNLEKLKVCAAAVPKTLPPRKRLQITPLLQLIAQMADIPRLTARDFLIEYTRLAPLFWEKEPFGSGVEVLAPPVQHCLHGCNYKTGKNKGMNRNLVWHRDPTEVTIFCGAGVVKRGLAVTLRCTACQSRYSYSTYTNYRSHTYAFYDEERPYLDVSQEVYVCRRFALELVNHILFNHATYDGFAETMRQTHKWDSLFSRKTVASVFMRHEIECDIREKGIHPYHFRENQSILQYLDSQMDEIFSNVYRHECSEACSAYQCGKIFIADGLWKIVFRHCTAQVTNVVESIPLINFPNVCTNAPVGTSLRCSKHRFQDGAVAEAERMSIHMTGVSRALQTNALKDINHLLAGEIDTGSTSLDCRKFEPNGLCAKNKGQNQGGHLYNRGYMFLVGPTGHVFAFSPIYRAESLGQVFLFLISTLYQLLQNVPQDQWEKVFICYDNMCQLNRLKAAKEPLPLEPPYDMMWARISKIIDGLHIQNHKDPKCQTEYHPEKFFETYPDAKSRNTMAAEQTFSWTAKFRKQLNAMTKARQIFFIHRMIVRRNQYLSQCLRENRRPVGGSVRAFKDTD